MLKNEDITLLVEAIAQGSCDALPLIGWHVMKDSSNEDQIEASEFRSVRTFDRKLRSWIQCPSMIHTRLSDVSPRDRCAGEGIL